MIRAVFLDIGETIIDETRYWAAWADWLGIPHLTFFGALGAAIERGEHQRAVFDFFRPGMDVHTEWQEMRQAGREPRVNAEDLYPDDYRACGCSGIGASGSASPGTSQSRSSRFCSAWSCPWT